MNNDDNARRTARAQTAIVRALTSEMQREGRGHQDVEDLRAQALEESARLVAAAEGLTSVRSSRPPRSPEGAEKPSTTGSRWPRVLVVEDDDATRIAIARGLAPEYDVVTAVNGQEGLEIASETTIDAIVADIAMPVMDGITMVDRIRRARGQTVPVLFLTAETAPTRVVESFAAGATSYLVKPVDLELLDNELRRALASHD